MSGDESTDKQCPLCMESLEFDDINFYPCKCEYQICSFCWHRLRTESNGLCPACRQAYPDKPVHFESVKGKPKKEKPRTPLVKLEQTIKDLSTYRVLQMNLIYVTGLSPRIADVDTLKKNEYFGQFGKILKLSISNGNGGSVNLSSACAYVTYSKGEEALRAILKFRNTVIDGRSVKVSLGTTKYCASFLRNIPCPKNDCSYCHELADMEISFTAEDMQQGKHSEYEKRLVEQFEKRLERAEQCDKRLERAMSASAPVFVPAPVPVIVPASQPVVRSIAPAPQPVRSPTAVPPPQPVRSHAPAPQPILSPAPPGLTQPPVRAPRPMMAPTPVHVQTPQPVHVQAPHPQPVHAQTPKPAIRAPVPSQIPAPFPPLQDIQSPRAMARKSIRSERSYMSMPIPMAPPNVSDSQAGLRALLPNVNVRFMEVKDNTAPPFCQPHRVGMEQPRSIVDHRFEACLNRFFRSFENGAAKPANVNMSGPPPGFSHLYQ